MGTLASSARADRVGPRCNHVYQSSCGTCRLNALCLPLALESGEVALLDRIVERSAPLRKHQHLYFEGDDFCSVYAVRSGTFKGYKVTDDGREQVTGFYFPGELLGMDGIGRNTHVSSAVALETSSVCEIPFNALEELSARLPRLQHHFFQLLSHEIIGDQELITLLSKNTADARVAALLLGISARKKRHAQLSSAFRLPMSRSDIGNYLGLTVETVSRVLGRLHRLGVVEVANKEIRILNRESLENTAGLQS